MQFLKEGLFTDERVLFVTIKDTPSQIKKTISSLEWEIDWAFDQQRFFILDIRDYFSGTNEKDRERAVFSNLLNEVSDILVKNDIRRVVFDPVLPEYIGVNDSLKQRYFTELMNMVESLPIDITILLINNEDAHFSSIETNVIKMYFEEDGEGVIRKLFPQKVLFTDYAAKELSFGIKSEVGIYIND